MFVPPSTKRKSGVLDALNAANNVLSTPGLPPEVWTPEGAMRWWIGVAGSCAVLAALSAAATWFSAGRHIEGMGGIVVLLTFYCWLGLAFFGLVSGLITALMTRAEEQMQCWRISAASGGLLILAVLFLAYH